MAAGDASTTGKPFTTSRRVEFRDTDAAGIVHFSAFFVWMEEAEHELLRAAGLTVFQPGAAGHITWPRVAAQANFHSAVRFEDQVDIRVRIARLGEKSATYAFEFSHAGRPVARGEITTVCCRFEAGSGPKSLPIPADIRAKLEPYVAN